MYRFVNMTKASIFPVSQTGYVFLEYISQKYDFEIPIRLAKSEFNKVKEGTLRIEGAPRQEEVG